MTTIRTQLRSNVVALMSLTVALTSFSYTSWRTERTEANRTTRQAAFQLLVALGQMQEVVFRAHYDHDDVRGNPRSGWVYVQTISDFSTAMPAPVRDRAGQLFAVWRDHWQGLGREEDEDAVAISDAVDGCRAAVVDTLRDLR